MAEQIFPTKGNLIACKKNLSLAKLGFDLLDRKRNVLMREMMKLIDEAVELMRNYHPNGERYYWVLYYSYMSAYQAENVEEILDKLEPHFPKLTRIHQATYFRWREQAFEAVSGILWGYEGENMQILEQFRDTCKPE